MDIVDSIRTYDPVDREIPNHKMMKTVNLRKKVQDMPGISGRSLNSPLSKQAYSDLLSLLDVEYQKIIEIINKVI